jgi:hypothetical protein
MKKMLLATTAFAGFVAIRAITGNWSAPLAPSRPRPGKVRGHHPQLRYEGDPAGLAY